MDTTAIGILFGIAASALHTIVRAIRQRTFSVSTATLVFLASFALPGCADLIHAGIQGQATELPRSWREYVAVAGIVAIGLAVQFIVQSYREAWSHKAECEDDTSDKLHKEDNQNT